MKGVELPINILVIVAIAVIVLLGMVLLYYTGFSPFSSVAGVEGTKNDACRVLAQERNCVGATSSILFDGNMLRQFDANKNNAMAAVNVFDFTASDADRCGTAAKVASSSDNLAALCSCYYGIKGATGENKCKALCSCPGYSLT